MENLDRRTSTYLLIAAFVGTLSACFSSAAALRYSIIPLADADGTVYLPSCINNKGDVAGHSSRSAFLYRQGTIRDLGWMGEELYVAGLATITDRGVIAGTAWDNTDPLASFRFTFTLGAARERDLSLANAQRLPLRSFFVSDMNEHGTMAGEVYHTVDRRIVRSTAAIYQDGELSALPGFIPNGYSVATAINKFGQVVGSAVSDRDTYLYHVYRPVLWSQGRIRDLGILPEFEVGQATAINDRGDIVGYCSDVNVGTSVGFIYRDGLMARLPSPPELQAFTPFRVNNAGDVLADVFPSQGPDGWYPGYYLFWRGQLHDLRKVLSDASGWTVYSFAITDMNDRGELVGYADCDDGAGSRVYKGFILVPAAN